MKARRRFLTFSLRTLFILLTASAVWLGVVVRRANSQREAVEAIEALGGAVTYDFQITGVPYDGTPDPQHVVDRFFDPYAEPPGPLWLRRFIGDDYFRRVVFVSFGLFTHDADVLEAIPTLERLPRLVVVFMPPSVSDETKNRVETAIPNCRVAVMVK